MKDRLTVILLMIVLFLPIVLSILVSLVFSLITATPFSLIETLKHPIMYLLYFTDIIGIAYIGFMMLIQKFNPYYKEDVATLKKLLGSKLVSVSISVVLSRSLSLGFMQGFISLEIQT